jgi:hypothetical protein
MTAKIIQFPHVLEMHQRTELQEFINGEMTKLVKKSFKQDDKLEESMRRMKAEIDSMVDNHDGYMVDLALKLIDQIIEDGRPFEHNVSVQLLKLRYVISQYCIM